MATETAPAVRQLMIEKIKVRVKQTKVKDGFVKMQLICKDSKSETGRTPVFFQVQADDEIKAMEAATARFKIGSIVAAREQSVTTAENEVVKVWQYYSSGEEYNNERFLNDEAAQLRVAEATAMAKLAVRKHSEAELAAMLS